MRNAVGFCLAAWLAAAPAGANAQGVAQRHIVLYKESAVPRDAARAIAAAGGELVRALPEVGVAIAVSSDPGFASRISRADRRVASVGEAPAYHLPQGAEGMSAPEFDGPTEDDDLFLRGFLWNIDRVHAPEAWAAGHIGSHDTVLAIIDSGVAWNHPDLAPNVVYADCFTSAGGLADGACNPYPSLSFHGTHIAGTAAAAFGGGRVVGVAPGIGIASYNVSECDPDLPDVCRVVALMDSRWAAMIDAANRDFDVISLSLGRLRTFGGKGSNDVAAMVLAEKRVANYVLKAGTTIVASAGNSSVSLNGRRVHLPGDLPGIVNVGATGIRPDPVFTPDSFDILAFYSNFGAPVDVVAPGGDCGLPDGCDPAKRPANWFEYLIPSTFVAVDPRCAETASCATGYTQTGGTSFAVPHAAAVAALVKDANPRLNPRQVAGIVERTAEDLGDRQAFGHGMVHAAAATAAALGR